MVNYICRKHPLFTEGIMLSTKKLPCMAAVNNLRNGTKVNKI